MIFDRFTYHFVNLLNIPGYVDYTALKKVTQQSTIRFLDDEPVFKKFNDEIEQMKEGKAPGRCGISA